MSNQKPDSETFLPPKPNLSTDPAAITAPFFKPTEPSLHPISKGSFAGDLNPFAQPHHPSTGVPVGGNLMGPGHFPFTNPSATGTMSGNAPNAVKPKFDPFGPMSGMGKFNADSDA